jgi:hypothetical protein
MSNDGTKELLGPCGVPGDLFGETVSLTADDHPVPDSPGGSSVCAPASVSPLIMCHRQFRPRTDRSRGEGRRVEHACPFARADVRSAADEYTR